MEEASQGPVNAPSTGTKEPSFWWVPTRPDSRASPWRWGRCYFSVHARLGAGGVLDPALEELPQEAPRARPPISIPTWRSCGEASRAEQLSDVESQMARLNSVSSFSFSQFSFSNLKEAEHKNPKTMLWIASPKFYPCFSLCSRGGFRRPAGRLDQPRAIAEARPQRPARGLPWCPLTS